MYRTRFIFGVSVLCLAAAMMVTACQGRGDAPMSTQTTPAPKPTPTKKTTKAPAKATTPSVHAQQPRPPAIGKPPAAAATTAKTTPPSAAPANAPLSAPAKLPLSDKATAAAKPTDKPPVPAKVNDKPVSKPADTKLAKAEQTKAMPPSSTRTTAPTTTATALTAVQEQLKQNPNLTAKLASRLPAGTDVVKAAEGFGNLGQFVAAANASSNLQLSFTDLKAKLIDGKMSLSQAIQAARPLTASPTIEAQRAEYDARGMIADSEQQPSQSATPPATAVASKSVAPATTTTVKQRSNGKKPAQ
jgi:hypothetical protein